MRGFAKLWILAIACIAPALTGCHNSKFSEQYLFTLYNNSNKVIGWYIPEPAIENGNDGYSFELPAEKPSTLYNEYQHIRPNGKYSFLEYEVSEAYGPSDAVKLYIFSTETLAEYTWTQIREGNLYEHCFELKVDELKANDRKVYYKAQ